MCPDGKMSSIGKYRRNLSTFEETAQYIQIFVFYFVIHKGLVLSIFQMLSLKPETNLLISNVSDLLFINIYHGIFLPIKMKVPLSTSKKKASSDFFVYKPSILEPRRDQYSAAKEPIVSKQSKDCEDGKRDKVPSRRQSTLVIDLDLPQIRSTRSNPITTIDSCYI